MNSFNPIFRATRSYDDLATKADIAALQSDIAGLERSLRAEIKSEIAALEQRLQRLIHQTQLQTLGIMAAMLVFAVPFVVVMVA